MVELGRRAALLTGIGIGAAPSLFAAGLGRSGPGFVRSRLELPHGVRAGEVTTDSAVLWARSSGDGRLRVRLSSNGRRLRSVRGAWAGERTDHTAKLTMTGLAPGREYEAAIWFESPDGAEGEVESLTFSTAPVHPAPTSFVWAGDVCGQQWGINQEYGGLLGFGAMLDARLDFFIQSGDSIYADETMDAVVTEPDGQVWRNLVTESHAEPAQSLQDYRARHRYPLEDEHVRRFHRAVPSLVQWDDHETTNNWWPGLVLDDERYTRERRCDLLAAYGRRAWQEYVPIADAHVRDRGSDGFAERRIYRRVPRGPHLDVFLLDMRSYREPNTTGLERRPRDLLGREQVEWLIREVSRSRATWKVISADLPLSIVGPARDTGLFDSYANGDPGAPLSREHELARVLSGFKANGVKNVVFVTADVHYTAAHHYHPSRAAFTDFDPFWEFVSGPIHASTFMEKEIDGTFGGEVVFAKGSDNGVLAQSPRAGNQFFGHVEISRDGAFTVNLRNTGGVVLWTRTLEPA